MAEDLAWLGPWLAAESLNGRADFSRTTPDDDHLDEKSQPCLDIVEQVTSSTSHENPSRSGTVSASVAPSQPSNTSGTSPLDQLSNQVSSTIQASSHLRSTNNPFRQRPHSHSIAQSASNISTARSGLPSIETSMYISRSTSFDTATSTTPNGGFSPSYESSPDNSRLSPNTASSFFSSWNKPSSSGMPDFSNARSRSSSSSQDYQQPAQHQRPDASHDRSSSHRMSITNAKIDPDKLQRRRTMARALLGPSSSSQARSDDYIGSQDGLSRRSVSSSASFNQLTASRESSNSNLSSWTRTTSAQEMPASPSLMASSLPSEGSPEVSEVQQRSVVSTNRSPISRSFSGAALAGANERGSRKDLIHHYSSFTEGGSGEGEIRRRVIIDGRLFEFEKDGRSLKLVENEVQGPKIVHSQSEPHESPLSSPLSLNSNNHPSNDQTLSPLFLSSTPSFYGDVYSIRGSTTSSVSGDIPDVPSPIIDSGMKSLGISQPVEQDDRHKGNTLAVEARPTQNKGEVSVAENGLEPASSTSAINDRPPPKGPNQPRNMACSEEPPKKSGPSTPQRAQAEEDSTNLSNEIRSSSEINPTDSPHSTASSNLPTPPMLDDSTLHEMKGYKSSSTLDQSSPSPSPLASRPHHHHTSSTNSTKSWSAKQLPAKLTIPAAETLSSQSGGDRVKRVGVENLQSGFHQTTYSEKEEERRVTAEEQYYSDEDDEPLVHQHQSRQQHQQSLVLQQSPQHEQQLRRAKSKNLPSPPLTSPIVLSGHMSNEGPRYTSLHVRSESAPADPYEVLSRPMPKEYNTQDIWKKGVKKLGAIGALGKAATRKGMRHDRPPPTGGLRNLTSTAPIYPKPSPGPYQFPPNQKGNHDVPGTGGIGASESFGLLPHATQLDHLRRAHQEPLREAVSPTVHTGGQIAARANAIENDEERKLAENMFM